MLSIKDINLLQAQNEGLKKQNAELQKENAELNAENETLKSQLDFEVQKKEVLEAKNERLIEGLGIANKYVNKYHQTLQEIKAIAEELLEKGLEPQSVEHQLRLRGKRELASIIIDLITKSESEVE